MTGTERETDMKLAYAIAVEGKTPDDAAKEWVAANPDLVAGWIGN